MRIASRFATLGFSGKEKAVMYPKLFVIPVLNLTVWTYGAMMCVGFLSAIFVIRRLSRDITPDPELITKGAICTMLAGVSGARLFYVVHHFDQFSGRLLHIFAIWQGGLELLGGVIAAVTVILLYLRYHKLPVRRYLDILAIGLLLALAFGRIGCFMKGCCFGKPTDVVWAVRFPYGSDAYRSQIYPNPKRGRLQPQLELPIEYFGCYNEDGIWIGDLKPYENLTEQQKEAVKNHYRCLPVHPTQLYSSANAVALCFVLFLIWRNAQRAAKQKHPTWFLSKPGCVFGLMFILYGISRFLLELLRDDNPFEFDSLTISQNIAIVMVILGLILTSVFATKKH